MACKILCHLPSPILLFLQANHSPFQPHWPLCCSSNTKSTPFPLSGTFFSPSDSHKAYYLTSSISLLQFRFFRDIFPWPLQSTALPRGQLLSPLSILDDNPLIVICITNIFSWLWLIFLFYLCLLYTEVNFNVFKISFFSSIFCASLIS